MLSKKKIGLANCIDYCESHFTRGYQLGQKSLSELSETYPVKSEGQEYILKYIKPQNLISIVKHDHTQIKRISALAKKVNDDCSLVATIEVVDMRYYNEDAVLLLKKQDLKEVIVKTETDFFNLGKALKQFHTSAASTQTYELLPWMSFPQNFIDALQREKRWPDVEMFLNKWGHIQESVALSVNHNDIHSGNVYQFGSKIFLLDLDEVCTSGFCNDLGMAIANFWNPNQTEADTLSFVRAILLGYKTNVNQEDIHATLVYAMRKLYFTEAYFIFISLLKIQDHTEFIDELKAREDQIRGIIDQFA